MKDTFFSCDWGTTSFRLRLVNRTDGSVLYEIKETNGIIAVYEKWLRTGYSDNKRIVFYKEILQSYINKIPGFDTENLPCIISGMAASAIGIKELPYAEVPLPLKADSLNINKIGVSEEFKHDIFLVSGLKTKNDVMRGEETILLGCDIDENKELIILPGTHSKHVLIENNTVADIKTYMTGEVFDLLVNKSILSKSVLQNEDSGNKDYFQEGVRKAVDGNILNQIFSVRTNGLFKNLTGEQNYYYLSGLVIGYELKDIKPDEKNIKLASSNTLGDAYLFALEVLGKKNNTAYINAGDALVKGHCRLVEYLFSQKVFL